MKGRLLAGSLLMLAGITGCSSGEGGQTSAGEGPPNILVAIADDWSWPHAGAYGDHVVGTPTFDRVAHEGILFQNAFVSSPSCTPSRAAILTGQYHWRLEESANLWSTLRAEFDVYPDLLEEAGYHVGYSGKGWGPGRWDVGGRTRNPAGNELEDFRTFLDERPEGAPFCYWFGSQDPHRPYEAGSGEEARIPIQRIQLFDFFPDHLTVRSDVADYYFEVRRFDREVGELLGRLEAMGELDTTLVVMTSDNGMPFPRCKATLYDCGTHVPLAIRWPAAWSERRNVEELVNLTDLAPTFLEAAGVPVPESMTGHSLFSLFSPSLGEENSPDRDAVFTGKERHVPNQEAPSQGGTPMRALRTRDFLYIHNLRPDRWPAGTPNAEKAYFPGSWYGDVDNGPTKSYMVDNRELDELHSRLFDLAFSRRPAEELYDLRKDPQQMTNVAGDPAYGEVLERMSDRLMKELEESGDPRLTDGERLEAYPYYGGSPLKPGWQ